MLNCCPGCTIEEGVDYLGNDIHVKENFPVSDQHDCARQCLTFDACNFWTFRPSNTRCWLKTSDSGHHNANQAYNSGSKGCGGESGKCISSIIIKQFSVCLSVIQNPSHPLPTTQPSPPDITPVWGDEDEDDTDNDEDEYEN